MKREAGDKLDQDILLAVQRGMQSIQHGSLVLVIQDGRIIQMELREVVRFCESGAKKNGRDIVREKKEADISLDKIKNRIAREIKDLHFGQVTFLIQNGRAVQIDRTEKIRYQDQRGMFGDGI